MLNQNLESQLINDGNFPGGYHRIETYHAALNGMFHMGNTPTFHPPKKRMDHKFSISNLTCEYD